MRQRNIQAAGFGIFPVTTRWKFGGANGEAIRFADRSSKREVGVPRGGGCLIWDVLVSIGRVADSMADYYMLSENWLLVVDRASYALRFFGLMKKLHSQPEGISLLANGSIAP